MEAFPVEVIGKILSHIGVVEQVVRASGTCRKWREAARSHLHCLSYRWRPQGSSVYETLTTEDLEVLLTETILQTSSLQDLSILTEEGFSATALMSWLLHTRDTLRMLRYGLVMQIPKRSQRLHANVLKRFGKMKCLEVLALFSVDVMDVDFAVQRWACLSSLIFWKVSVSASDLNALLSACPKLESFALKSPTIISIDPRSTLTLTSSSLKEFKLENTTTRVVDNIILEAELLNTLDLKACTLQHFGVVSKGNLRILRIRDACFSELDIGPDTDMLEVLHVSNSTIPWVGFGHLISKVPNLKVLQLRGLESRAYSDLMNLETIARSFPRLNHLSVILNDELMKGNMDQVLLAPHTSLLEKLVSLELEATTALNDMLCCWIEMFVEICPNLERLVVRGNTQQAQGMFEEGNPNSVGGFITSFVKLVRKFSKVDIQYQDI
jgi:hypothetical protein